ncbi:MAG: hypothetical protein VCA36_12530, partial [Opitutales bacterium]
MKGGVSLIAFAAMVGLNGTAMATDITSTTNTSPTTQADGATMTFGTDGAYGFLDSDANNTILGTTVTEDGTLYIEDSGDSGDKVDFTSTVAITSGKTFTIELGKTKAGVASHDVDLQFSS